MLEISDCVPKVLFVGKALRNPKDANGLSADVASERLKNEGPNELEKSRRPCKCLLQLEFYLS